MLGTVEFAYRALVGMHKNVKPMFGFNLAERCPVGCDCYWRKDLADRLNLPRPENTKELPLLGKKLEMSDEEVIDFFRYKKAEGFVMVLIIGGEPYVRPELLCKLGGIIPWTGVVTSGTTPLMRMEKTFHYISIDGKDAETHDKVRKSSGLFERIVKNVRRVRFGYVRFPLAIHTVLNKMNFMQMEEITKFWVESGMADWVIFSGHTPILGANDDHLHLSADDSKRLVDELHTLKSKYPKYINMTHGMIDLLSPDRMSTQTPETCPTAKFTDAFYANGEKIDRCIFGKNGDCSRCGCIVTIGFEPLKRKIPDLESLRVAWRLRP